MRAATDTITRLGALGVTRGVPVAVAVGPGTGLGLAVGGSGWGVVDDDPITILADVESALAPRWVWWDRATAASLAAGDVAVGRCWDICAVQQLLDGGGRPSIAEVWARLHGLDATTIPSLGQLDLLTDGGDEGDPDHPVRPDGHLRPEWLNGTWNQSAHQLGQWAAIADQAATAQRQRIGERDDAGRVLSTAHAESAAELLCAELGVGGLPFDVADATRIIAAAVGPRPTDERDADRRRAERDDAVLDHLGDGRRAVGRIDLRNPADVRSLLRRVGLDLPDTRAWRLEQHRDAHPVVEALLEWRKAERIATTYGYRWLGEHVRGRRLRGEWISSDGAAGRMTATAGLHNLPAELRPAVSADPGSLFVRADLGQIEPRVLAAVSGDANLIRATRDDDLYLPVAQRLRVERSVAKVAVLGAMYGATTGESAHALRRLEREYPVAMRFLETAAAAGRRGDSVVTIGGRRVPMWIAPGGDGDLERAHRVAASRGRFARNAVIQGAAAELFKVWAVTVRARGRTIGAQIVLCLHDELLVQVDAARADDASELLRRSLDEAAHRWSPQPEVRFVAEVSVVERWSDA